MEISDLLNILFRWFHIAAGILWIGLLYFFNFVNAPFSATLDGETKKKIVPELMPRGLFFFRWGALVTWVTGLLLLGLVFYHGGLMFEQGEEAGWGVAGYIMLAVVFLGFGIYDQLAKSALGKNQKVFAAVGFILIVVVIYALRYFAGFSYRAYVIHTGVLFGTIMAANVWMRIWPLQRKIIAVVKGGTPPDPAMVALAGTRSKHNTYLSVPLIYTMINAHTVVPGADSWLYLPAAVLIGWLAIMRMYRLSAGVKGI